jgi:hypothetical protein
LLGRLAKELRCLAFKGQTVETSASIVCVGVALGMLVNDSQRNRFHGKQRI